MIEAAGRKFDSCQARHPQAVVRPPYTHEWGAYTFANTAINTYRPWTAASLYDFRIDLDTTGSGKPNFAVFARDLGLLTSGAGAMDT